MGSSMPGRAIRPCPRSPARSPERTGRVRASLGCRLPVRCMRAMGSAMAELEKTSRRSEACAAFILSQKHKGWTVLPTLYDDGGFSGGTMERPALKRLMIDIEAGQVDTVVVYK